LFLTKETLVKKVFLKKVSLFKNNFLKAVTIKLKFDEVLTKTILHSFLDKCLGCVNMREAQINIKKHFKKEKITLCWEGVVSQLGGSITPRGGG